MNYQCFLKGVVYKMNVSFLLLLGVLLRLLKQMKFVPYLCGPFLHIIYSTEMGSETVFPSRTSFKVSTIQAGEMCWLHNTNDPSSIPWAHIAVEEENRFHKVDPWPPHVHCGMHAPHPTHTSHSNNNKLEIKNPTLYKHKLATCHWVPSLGFPSNFLYFSTLLLWLRWTHGSQFSTKELLWSSGVDCMLNMSSVFSREERKSKMEERRKDFRERPDGYHQDLDIDPSSKICWLQLCWLWPQVRGRFRVPRT